LGFLDLHDHLGTREDFFRIVDDRSARGDVLVVGQADLKPGAGLDHHLVAVRDQLVNARGRQADAILVIFYLFWNAY
jgi:hypothetical protein